MFGKREDPTAHWPTTGAAPELDLERHTVGPLALGDRFEEAEKLGRPKRVRGSVDAGRFTLEYASFELEFDRSGLVCVKFDIDEGAIAPCTRDIRLSHATRPVDAQVWFGEPTSDSTVPGGRRFIDFEQGGATLALEFTDDALTCVQLYAEGYA